MSPTGDRGPVAVEVRLALDPEGEQRVPLQLPDGYILIKRPDALRVARLLHEVAHGDAVGVWDRLGMDEDTYMPTHLAMGLTATDEGPEDDHLAHHFWCWCTERNCPLDHALRLAGTPQEERRAAREEPDHAGDDDVPF